MTKILQSFNPYVFALPEAIIDGKLLPAVDLPKNRYRPGETYINGPRKGFQARPICELTELEQERLTASPQIQQMIAKGVYRWLDKIPESMQTTEDLVSDLRAENAALKAGNTKVDTESSIVDAEKEALRSENQALKDRIESLSKVDEVVIPKTAPGQRSTREELMAKPYKALQVIASGYGVKNSGISKAAMVDLIMDAAGYKTQETTGASEDENEELEGSSSPDEID